MPNLVLEENHMKGIFDEGLRLANMPMAQGGWLEYFDEAQGMGIANDQLRASTALMLENAKRNLARSSGVRRNNQGLTCLNEGTRSGMVGGFSDYLFPIIRAAFPTNPINDIVSVQPTTRKTATILRWHWTVGKTKGSFRQGDKLFDANHGKQHFGHHFSDNVIDAETVGTGTGASAVIAGTLNYHDGGGVIPGTVSIVGIVSASPVTASDDSNGGFVGLTGTIDYTTGIFSVTYGSNVDVSTSVVASYQWNSEGSSEIPEVDVSIETSTIETRRRALKLNVSQESMQDAMQEFGVSLESELVSGISNQLNDEVASELIEEMWTPALVNTTFSLTQPGTDPGYSRTEHFSDIRYNLNQASDSIEARTQKGYGNFIICDSGAANMLRTLPSTVFAKSPTPKNVGGLYLLGTLDGQYRVYKYKRLNQLPGAAAVGNMLMGYKGSKFYEAGMVYSPYKMMYSTDPLQTADFITQQGFASRYATHMVNSGMYTRINLSA